MTVIFYTLNGAGIVSVQGKWDEMFGEKKKVTKAQGEKPIKKLISRKKNMRKSGKLV